jgi:hypothetical protein
MTTFAVIHCLVMHRAAISVHPATSFLSESNHLSAAFSAASAYFAEITVTKTTRCVVKEWRLEVRGT